MSRKAPSQPTRETMAVDNLRVTKASSRNDRYAKILKPDRVTVASVAAESLPWLKMPRSAAVCEQVADECRRLAGESDGELGAFWESLGEHVAALSDFHIKRAAANV